MKARFLHLLALSPVAILGACAGASQDPTGPQVDISIAPLTLPGVAGVEYALAVFNANPGTGFFDSSGAVVSSLTNLVWSRTSVTSNKFGNDGGGDIAYVGPCDASTGDNYVAVALKQVDVGTGGSVDGTGPFAGVKNVLDDQITAPVGDGDADFANPCPYDNPCMLHFPCVENQDTPVVFDLTVMRDANQGFFDIAVNFDDIYCAAKYDSCYDDDVPVQLLFGDDTDTDTTNDPADALGDEPGRDRTGVFALACTAGPSTGIATDLLISQVQVTCGAVAFFLPIAGLTPPGGNHIRTIDLDDDAVPDDIQYATYFGSESLACGGTSCNKAYLSIAINLEDLPRGCKLSLQATAQDANAPAFTNGSVTNMATSGATYAFIDVTDADLDEDTCVQNPLNGDGSSVSTIYGSSMSGGQKPELMCGHSTTGSAPAFLADLQPSEDGWCHLLAPPPDLRVFVTPSNTFANMGGLTGADGKCQAAATAAGLVGTWMAWLSAGTDSPSTRFTPGTRSGSKFVLVDGTVVADNWADLTDGQLNVPIRSAANGTVQIAAPVWTNTYADGTSSGVTDDCSGFTVTSGATHVLMGKTDLSDGGWTNLFRPTGGLCFFGGRLFCFEQAQ